MTIEPVFVDKKRSDNINDYVQVRPRVDRRIWKLFKAVVQMCNYNQSLAITDALKLWIEKNENITLDDECVNCQNNVTKSDAIVVIIKGQRMSFCSSECFSDYFRYYFSA